MTAISILKILLMLSIFLVVFSLALKSRTTDAFFLLRNPALGLRAFFSMYLVVPIVAVALAASFDLSTPVKIALIAISLSPVPPLVPTRQMMTGSPDYVISLLLLAAAATIVVAPLGIIIIGNLFDLDLTLNVGAFVAPLLITIALPLALGRIAAHVISEASAETLTNYLTKGAMAFIGIAALLILFAKFGDMVALMHNGTVLVMIAMSIAGLLSGYFLAGGPRYKMPLAYACSARHPAVAIAIATTLFPENSQAVLAILLYVIVTTIIAIATLVYYKKHHPPEDAAT